MRIRLVTVFALSLALSLAACGGKAKKGPAGPPAEDVPQEVTCCFDAAEEGAVRQVMPVDKCPEANRNPVDSCDIGPGDAEAPM